MCVFKLNVRVVNRASSRPHADGLAAQPDTMGTAHLDAVKVLDKYFPQHRHCGDGSWRQEYAALHHNILSGQHPPRYLTSVAAQTGLADRITGAGYTHQLVGHLSSEQLCLERSDSKPAAPTRM